MNNDFTLKVFMFKAKSSLCEQKLAFASLSLCEI